MYQPADATLSPAQLMVPPTTEIATHLPPQLPPQMPPVAAAAEASMFFLDTTGTYLTQTITPITTTGIYTHSTTEYPYHSMHSQTTTRNSLITPILTTPNPIASPPKPSHEVLNLSNVDPDSDHEREIVPMKTRRMGFGTVKLWDVGAFSMVTDAFCFTIDISNARAPTIPMEYRKRFERILCNAYRKCTPTPGGVLKASQDDYWVYAIMITGTCQEAIEHIKTGIEEVRAHARLRRLSTLSFSRLGSGRNKCNWDQMEFLYHAFWQDSVTIHMHNC